MTDFFYCNSFQIFFLALKASQKEKNSKVVVISEKKDIIETCERLNIKTYEIPSFSINEFLFKRKNLINQLDKDLKYIEGGNFNFSHTQFDIYCFILIHLLKKKKCKINFYDIELQLNKMNFSINKSYIKNLVFIIIIFIQFRLLLTLRKLGNTAVISINNDFKKNITLKKINYNFFEMINDVTTKIKLNYGVNKIIYLDQNFSKSSQIESQSLKILYDYIAKLDVDIKFHPYMNSTAKFPNCFSLPTFLPSELLCADKKVVISISSIGLISPSFNNNIKSISLMNLVNFNCINNKKKIFDFLYENSKGKILFPSSFNELNKIILSS